MVKKLYIQPDVLVLSVEADPLMRGLSGSGEMGEPTAPIRKMKSFLN